MEPECYQCEEYFVLNNYDTCIECEETDTHDPRKCLKCIEGHILHNEICFNCREIDINCIECSSDNLDVTCTECETNFLPGMKEGR